MPKLPIIGSSAPSQSAKVSLQEMLNLYVEKVGAPGEPDEYVAFGRPGRLLAYEASVAGTGASAIRGIWANAERCFFVVGPYLCELLYTAPSTWSHGLHGNVGDAGAHTPVTILSNGHQLLIVSDGKAYYDAGDGSGVQNCNLPAPTGTCDATGYIVTATDKVAFGPEMVGAIKLNGTSYTCTEVLFGGNKLRLSTAVPTPLTGATYLGPATQLTASSAAYLDGYFLVARPSSGLVNYTENPSSWSNLDTFSAEGYPDHLVAIHADHEELYLLGTETIEVWRDVGDATNPFQRSSGTFIHQGCIAPYAVNSAAEAIYFLGADTRGGAAAAFRIRGFQLERISTPEVEAAWAASSIDVVSSTTGLVYTEGGHTFWQLGFTQATWVYDITTGIWATRGYWSGSALSADKAECHGYVTQWGAKGLHIVGGRASSKLWLQSLSYTDDDGDSIRYVRTMPHVRAEDGQRVYFRRIQLDFETGTVASGTAPAISLYYTDDNGTTWSSALTGDLGTHGQLKRVFWNRLGKSFDRVWRFVVVAKCRIAIPAGYVRFDVGAH
jgi:hypothetical protein